MQLGQHKYLLDMLFQLLQILVTPSTAGITAGTALALELCPESGDHFLATVKLHIAAQRDIVPNSSALKSLLIAMLETQTPLCI